MNLHPGAWVPHRAVAAALTVLLYALFFAALLTSARGQLSWVPPNFRQPWLFKFLHPVEMHCRGVGGSGPPCA
jgi:hypothetical protein